MPRKSQHLSDYRYKTVTSGIYAIVNKINNKMYIGSAVILQKREKEHFLALRKGLHANRYLQFSFNKYGADTFEFKILETIIDEAILIEREQYWMDFYNTVAPNGYNLKPFAYNNLGLITSEEAKEKNRQKHLGKKLSEETKAKMSAVRKGRKQNPEWIEARVKSTADKLRGRKQSPENIKIRLIAQKEAFEIRRILKRVILLDGVVFDDKLE